VALFETTSANISRGEWIVSVEHLKRTAVQPESVENQCQQLLAIQQTHREQERFCWNNPVGHES